MKSQVLHTTAWCYISGEAAGETLKLITLGSANGCRFCLFTSLPPPVLMLVHPLASPPPGITLLFACFRPRWTRRVRGWASRVRRTGRSSWRPRSRRSRLRRPPKRKSGRRPRARAARAPPRPKAAARLPPRARRNEEEIAAPQGARNAANTDINYPRKDLSLKLARNLSVTVVHSCKSTFCLRAESVLWRSLVSLLEIRGSYGVLW